MMSTALSLSEGVLFVINDSVVNVFGRTGERLEI